MFMLYMLGTLDKQQHYRLRALKFSKVELVNRYYLWYVSHDSQCKSLASTGDPRPTCLMYDFFVRTSKCPALRSCSPDCKRAPCVGKFRRPSIARNCAAELFD